MADLTVALPGEIKSVFILWRSTALKDIDKVDIPAMVVSDKINHEKRLAFYCVLIWTWTELFHLHLEAPFPGVTYVLETQSLNGCLQ